MTKRTLHESATSEQVQAAPVGTIAHRNYLCPSLEPERRKHAPPALRHRAAVMAEGGLAFERGLMHSIASTVPQGSDERYILREFAQIALNLLYAFGTHTENVKKAARKFNNGEWESL